MPVKIMKAWKYTKPDIEEMNVYSVREYVIVENNKGRFVVSNIVLKKWEEELQEIEDATPETSRHLIRDFLDSDAPLVYEDEIKFNEISPEELKEKYEFYHNMIVEKSKETMKYLEGLAHTVIPRFKDDEKKISKIRSKPYAIRLESLRSKAYDVSIDPSSSIAELKVAISEIEEIDKEEISEKPYIFVGPLVMKYDSYCDDDSGYVDNIYFDRYQTIKFELDAEKRESKNFAMMLALFNHVGKIFRFDCTIVNQFMEGDLTYKGFIKHIDLRNQLSC